MAERRKILVADDDPSIREILSIQLARMGYEVILACDGAEAVEAYKMASFARKPYSLVCLDINLPDKSGLEVLVDIRRFELYQGASLGTPAKIFMTTAESTPGAVSDSLGLCNEYLLKPIDRKKLTERLIKHGLIK